MKLELSKAPRRLPGSPWLWLALGAYVAGVGIVTWLASRLGREIILCPLKRATGLPCPTCGVTRGGLLLLRGRVADAFACNPLVFTFLSVAFGVLALRAVGGVAIRVRLTRPERIAAWCIAAALLAANWVYVILFVG
jgi:hypothetical protein